MTSATRPALHHLGGDGHYKDAILDRLAGHANVAQFVSFAPGGEPALRFVRLARSESRLPRTVEGAVAAVLSGAPEGSVNVRAFDPSQPKAHEFIYGLTSLADVASEVRRLARSGLHTIVNETVDVGDGGVSGVMYGGVIEFAPGDTPRCVEKPGTAAFDRHAGLLLLATVYGFELALDQPDDVRTEFSVHPLRRGLRGDHTIIWEEERTEPVRLATRTTWPNRFSRFLGDKLFGLLVADTIGLRVPHTVAITRTVSPFTFGLRTGSGETWIRTAPPEPVPGFFTTKKGWIDPFELLATEDPAGDGIAAVLSQDGVSPAYSGAAATSLAGTDVTVEGVRGAGDRFMLGEAVPEPLPAEVTSAVREAMQTAVATLGPVRFEWVHDGSNLWVVQLHVGGTVSRGYTIYPGNPAREHRFPATRGIEALRDLVSQVAGTGDGVVIEGSVGVTSHFGDVLRKAHVPARIEPPRVSW